MEKFKSGCRYNLPSLFCPNSLFSPNRYREVLLVSRRGDKALIWFRDTKWVGKEWRNIHHDENGEYINYWGFGMNRDRNKYSITPD